MRSKSQLHAFVLLAALAVAGCASDAPRLTNQQDQALYRTYAGKPVKSFPYFGGIRQWETVGDSGVAVWTRPDTAFLLDVSQGCLDLEWSPSLSMTTEHDRVHVGFNDILVQRTGDKAVKRCRIQAIRPLDVKGLRNAQKQLADLG
jgi:hypothetical protein